MTSPLNFTSHILPLLSCFNKLLPRQKLLLFFTTIELQLEAQFKAALNLSCLKLMRLKQHKTPMLYLPSLFPNLDCKGSPNDCFTMTIHKEIFSYQIVTIYQLSKCYNIPGTLLSVAYASLIKFSKKNHEADETDTWQIAYKVPQNL